jgi:glutathione S-transferase
MSIPTKIRIHELAPSPNCMKARIGMNLKSVPFKKIAANPTDRSAIVKAFGQPLTPAMEAGDMKLFDSHAILRWLDANAKQGPRLFSPDYEGMKAIEEWEVFARTGLRRGLRPMFGMAFGRMPVEDGAVAAANAALNQDTAGIEAALEAGPWLMGERISAADVMVAPLLYWASAPEHEVARALPFYGVMRRFDLGPNRERTRDWVARVMAWDCWINPAASSTAKTAAKRPAAKAKPTAAAKMGAKAVKPAPSTKSKSKSKSKAMPTVRRAGAKKAAPVKRPAKQAAKKKR